MRRLVLNVPTDVPEDERADNTTDTIESQPKEQNVIFENPLSLIPPTSKKEFNEIYKELTIRRFKSSKSKREGGRVITIYQYTCIRLKIKYVRS
ncbi:hypothetical protein RCL_jg2603.t1 [Rhizophagus clarus]|uniref:Uncharacterized protein n=1 Tax=Rhizophagus clarus TaxID=94130 RepID=A0A8H3QQS7_9GLOM|nr:hypothetical protein RCL_jg2603.t1 [Rhizophagus clarus]